MLHRPKPSWSSSSLHAQPSLVLKQHPATESCILHENRIIAYWLNCWVITPALFRTNTTQKEILTWCYYKTLLVTLPSCKVSNPIISIICMSYLYSWSWPMYQRSLLAVSRFNNDILETFPLLISTNSHLAHYDLWLKKVNENETQRLLFTIYTAMKSSVACKVFNG